MTKHGAVVESECGMAVHKLMANRIRGRRALGRRLVNPHLATNHADVHGYNSWGSSEPDVGSSPTSPSNSFSGGMM